MKTWKWVGVVGMAVLPAVVVAAPKKAKSAADAGTAAAAPAAPAVPAEAQAEADKIFTTLCSTCHGVAGKGDGAAAAALNPKPRTFTDVAWQGSVTDDQIGKTILNGGASVGKSPLMPPNPQLKDKPEVIRGLVAKVRSFKGKT